MDRKTKWMALLFIGGSMFVLTTLVMWLIGDAENLEKAAFLGAMGALVSLPVFWWAMSRISKRAALQVAELEDVFFEEEQVLFQGNATHFKGLEGVGGLLVLTANRLVFQSAGLNVQQHRWEIQLAAVRALERRKTLGFIPNGLAVTDQEGNEERFVVVGAGNWLAAIEEARTT